MRVLTLVLFLSFSIHSFSQTDSQTEYRIPFEGFVAIDSKEGMNVLKDVYNFIVSIKPDSTVILKRKESNPATDAMLIEQTDKYVTAKISETGYFFYDIEDALVFTIDKFKEQYITMAYADDLEKVIETAKEINKWQQAGKKPEEILSMLKEKMIED